MLNISFSFDSETNVIHFSQDINSFDPDCDSDVDVYIATVLTPPPGIMVRGNAVEFAMHKVIAHRDLDVFLAALVNLHPDNRDMDLFFSLACQYYNMPVVQHVRAFGANINGHDDINPLCLCVDNFSHRDEMYDVELTTRHFALIRYLLTFDDLDINCDMGNGKPWTHLIDENYPLDIIQSFLRKGADPNSYGDEDYTTPLCVAAEFGNMETVQTLLLNGADPYVYREEDYKFPRELAQNSDVINALDFWPGMLTLYCFNAVGVSIDADSVADFVDLIPPPHAYDSDSDSDSEADADADDDDA